MIAVYIQVNDNSLFTTYLLYSYTGIPGGFYKRTVTGARAGFSGHKESKYWYAKQLILSTKQFLFQELEMMLLQKKTSRAQVCIYNPLIIVTVYIVPRSHLGVRSLFDNARLMAQQRRKMVKQKFPVKKPLMVNILMSR